MKPNGRRHSAIARKSLSDAPLRLAKTNIRSITQSQLPMAQHPFRPMHELGSRTAEKTFLFEYAQQRCRYGGVDDDMEVQQYIRE